MSQHESEHANKDKKSNENVVEEETLKTLVGVAKLYKIKYEEVQEKLYFYEKELKCLTEELSRTLTAYEEQKKKTAVSENEIQRLNIENTKLQNQLELMQSMLPMNFEVNQSDYSRGRGFRNRGWSQPRRPYYRGNYGSYNQVGSSSSSSLTSKLDNISNMMTQIGPAVQASVIGFHPAARMPPLFNNPGLNAIGQPFGSGLPTIGSNASQNYPSLTYK